MEDSDTRKNISLSPYIKAVQVTKEPPFTKDNVKLFEVACLTAGRRKGRQTPLIAWDNVPDIYCKYSGISVAYFWNTVEYFKNRSVVWVVHCSLASERERLWRAE